VPGLREVGTTIHQRLSLYLVSNPETVDTAHCAVAVNNKQGGEQSEKHVGDVRQMLADTVGAADVSPVYPGEYQPTVRAELLAA